MNKLFLYNTLSRQKEEFKPISKKEVGLYTCGPTVYNFAHIGNLRTYLFEDWLKRILSYNNFNIKHVMNVTDVGHLVGDGDDGEDKMEKGAAREGKSAWEIADFYLAAFKKDLESLNIIPPTIYCKVTDYIPEQIELIKTLETKGFAYKTSDGLYFDTSLFPDYNKLSRLKLEDLAEGSRVEINPEKRNPTDFALWKFSPSGAKRQMEWDSPWGIGFPGWHIECSALSLKFLGSERDIHCGGADHINVHHTNEIAQSEAATGEKYFNYWIHGAFLNVVGGKKMAKSADNFLTIDNALIKKGLHPLAYRFAAASVHYRKPMEYSEESLRQAQNGWKNLLKQIAALEVAPGEINKLWQDSFMDAVNDDLNIPQALAITQDLLKSDLSKDDKLATVLDFDKVLGLGFSLANSLVDNEIFLNDLLDEDKKLVLAREQARADKDFAESDRLRHELKARGIAVEDTKDGMKFTTI
ncbi:MAG: cysteine--tRNA ligase [Patescibacteria group bacterium]